MKLLFLILFITHISAQGGPLSKLFPKSPVDKILSKIDYLSKNSKSISPERWEKLEEKIQHQAGKLLQRDPEAFSSGKDTMDLAMNNAKKLKPTRD